MIASKFFSLVNSTLTTAPRRFLLSASICYLAACGGGGGGSGATARPTPPATTNVVPIVVDAGPTVGSQQLGTINLPYVSVTICTPGTGQCQTIDHILVDTGSTGLRVMASVLSISLPIVTSGSNNILECAQFAAGYSWGPIKLADFKVANQTVTSLPIQVIGDSNFAVAPTSCSNLGASLNSVATFGANGVLGVGVFEHDCPACAQNFPPDVYFSCSGLSCQATTRSLAQQVTNPVSRFATDNNGVVIDLPAVPANGATTVNGSLIFGIGTQSNNALVNARVLALNSSGYFTTMYNNVSLLQSFVDSGSNGLFFPDNNIPVCSANSNAPGFFCPTSTLTLSAVLQSTVNGANVPITFTVANTSTLLTNNPTHTAFNNIGGDSGGLFFNSFDWGSPFFFGRRVFTAIEGRSTAGGTGPYIAY